MTAGEVVVVARRGRAKAVAGEKTKASSYTPLDLDKDLYSHNQAGTYDLF
jgi:hypothetical protein